MKNYLDQLFAPNAQGKTNAFGSNPDTISLANLLYAQGQPFDQAIINAAQLNYQTAQQRNNEILQQQKMLQAAQEQEALQRRQQALQLLGGQEGVNPLLFGGQFDPSEIKTLNEVITPPKPDLKEVFNQENKLRDEFISLSKDWKQINDAYPRILSAAQNPSPAGDISLLYGFMKLNDPNSTVREGEYATAENAGSIPERVRQQYNKALQGQRLTAPMRVDFINQAGKLYTAQYKNQQKLQQQYSALAKRNNLNPENIIIDYQAKNENPNLNAPKVSKVPKVPKTNFSIEEIKKEIQRRKAAGLL